jgi:hypothetical protein
MSENASKVVHVRVYIDRATVTRRRVLTLQPGLHAVTFGPLPQDLDASTFQAKATAASAALTVAGLTTRLAYQEPPSGRREAVAAQLDAQEAKLQALEDAASSDRHAVERLAEYAELATDRLSAEWLEADPPFPRWLQIFDQLRERRGRLAATEAARKDEQARAQRRRDELVAELSRLGQRKVLGQEVQVSLQVPGDAPSEVTVELSYGTSAASWMPAYDARVEDEGGAVKVALSGVALVRQTTGEDWEDVELVATTARPPLAEPPPELMKLEVSGRPGVADKEVIATHDAGPRLGGAGAPPPPEAPAATVEHAARGRVNIPCTGRPVRVELFSEAVPATRRLEVAALHRPVAIWVLDVSNTTGRILLPGAVSLFRGPNYSGRAQLGFVASHERFRLPLGTEGGLRIQRKTHAQPAKTAMVTGSQSREYETHTTLENLGSAPVELWVRERVPVSRIEAVTVDRLALPPGSQVDDETGLLEALVKLAPREKRDLSVRFRVSAPKGFTLRPPGAL